MEEDAEGEEVMNNECQDLVTTDTNTGALAKAINR